MLKAFGVIKCVWDKKETSQSQYRSRLHLFSFCLFSLFLHSISCLESNIACQKKTKKNTMVWPFDFTITENTPGLCFVLYYFP